MWKCPKCKYENDDRNDFCANCGQIMKGKEKKYTLVLWHKPRGKPVQRFKILGQAVLGVSRDSNTGIDIDLSELENSSFISKLHARVFLDEPSGVWTVEDLGSTNGTFINGRRISALSELKRGDELTIGKSVFTVK
ncbi:FHA domain-containing protein [uncultured Mesotoga sp.]|uniref:FHA domain-containing protein n=1 Tax=uncultured Mesotoga sp. TaxID=1184400 RepID=UPI0025972F46|nr:FHA domain-containing protein [uncultured Mesotoga sp.]